VEGVAVSAGTDDLIAARDGRAGARPAASVPCRACGATEPVTVLDLGVTPIANALVRDDELDRPERAFPLAMALCERCGLAQLTESVPGEVLFDQSYPYYSSFSPHLIEHARLHAVGLIEQLGLGADSFVVEVASNDGYLLQHFVERGIPVLGIDPSPGPAAAAIAAGVPTIVDFFRPELARAIVAEHGQADAVVANNVMAHVPDLNGFVESLRIRVADDGIVTVENPWVRDLVQHCEFDTIYHEHHCYFSSTAVSRLAGRHGLRLVDVEYFPELHGGTLRWSLSPTGEPSAAVREHLALEDELGVATAAYFHAFDERVHRVRRDLRALLESLKADGRSIAAYGAAAKGATLLNTTNIGTELIDFVVDRNPFKQGKHLPGVHIPICAPEALLDQRPDYVLLLAWNFASEIAEQQREYLEAGGRFIVPVPTPMIM
jgi:SAM-dependent methyltransferase